MTTVEPSIQPAGSDGQLVLDVVDLTTHIQTSRGTLIPADGVSFSIKRGQAVALVGESGSGKTITALSIMRLVRDPVRIVGGRVLLNGRNLLSLSEGQMREVRGTEIAMVFQDPMTFLNPVFKIGDQLMEAILLHQKDNHAEAKERALEALAQVRIAAPSAVFDHYPHQLSGGMRQRVLIAMAISCQPNLIVADEPTTALDVTVQAQIMELLMAVREEIGSSLLLITHDLGLVAGYCDRVCVMYAGKVVESGDVFSLFERPGHPYTEALLGCSVRPDRPPPRFGSIPGQVPNLIMPPPGCRFEPRCPLAMDVCRQPPPSFKLGDREVACWLHDPRAVEANVERPEVTRR